MRYVTAVALALVAYFLHGHRPGGPRPGPGPDTDHHPHHPGTVDPLTTGGAESSHRVKQPGTTTTEGPTMRNIYLDDTPGTVTDDTADAVAAAVPEVRAEGTTAASMSPTCAGPTGPTDCRY